MTMIYHNKSNVITCVCGTLITGAHTCKISVKSIKIKVCDNSDKKCFVCWNENQKQKYKDQWKTDVAGYCVCAVCGVKTDGFLPKVCSCHAYIDADGWDKCKNCNIIWEELDFDDQCSSCEYMGE